VLLAPFPDSCRQQQLTVVTSSFLMALSAQLVPIGFSLAAMLCWGTSDFSGGYATRRAPALLFTTCTHAAGALLMLALAEGSQSSMPAKATILWSLIAGALAGVSLAIFYAALASGKMGIVTPVTAVLSAGIPAVVAIATEGAPGATSIAGFALACAGIWLVSRVEGGDRPQGLGLAVVSGIGFAGYFLCVRQAGNGSPLWIAGLSRACSFFLTGAIVLLWGRNQRLRGRDVGFAILTGCIDVSGSAFFIRALQHGRLDSVVVLSSLYPTVTVVLARLVLKEHLTKWKVVGMASALAAVPLIALR
jgi:drug/metabolite transporter (DMT)-like permease